MRRIRRIADELGFARNPHAAGLRTSRSNLAGVLVPKLTDIVLATIYEGVDEAARRLGFQTFVANTLDRDQERRAGVEMFLARRVDGLILGDARIDDSLLDSLADRQIPFVLVSRHSGAHPAVTCDDYEGGRLAAQHLLGLGHRDVAIIAGENYASTAVDRVAGFVETFAAAGHPIPASHIVPSAFDVGGGREAAQQVLAESPRPTALFAVNDFAAIGALGAIRAGRLSAGRDIAVVGYNDTPLAGELPIPLTSVRSPMQQMGREAMEMLVRQINGDQVESRRLTPTLSVRESTDPTVENAPGS